MQTILSGGKPIRIHTLAPQNASGARHPAVLLLHGAGGNVYFWLDKIAPAIARHGIAVYGIHYFDATGTHEATPDVLADGISIPLWLQTVRDALRWIAAQPGVDPERIALVGVSLGAFISLALGTEAASAQNTNGLPIRAIVDLSGGLIPPWESQATAAYPPTLILHGESDPMVPVQNARTLDAVLTRLAVPHQLHTFPHEGHWFTLAAQIRILELIGAFLNKYL